MASFAISDSTVCFEQRVRELHQGADPEGAGASETSAVDFILQNLRRKRWTTFANFAHAAGIVPGQSDDALSVHKSGRRGVNRR